MSSRELWVRISANVSGFTSGIAQAQGSLTAFDKSLQQSAEKRDAINKLGTAFGVIGLAAAAAGAAAVKSFADFDAAMSAVKATGDDAAESIDALCQAALDAGAETAFSATESAEAIENLAKAGITAADILSGGLDGALSLAAAGGLDVATAAEIAAVAMTQFSLKGSEIPHVADLLSAAAGKANGEVTDMGQALGQAGLVAGQMGLSIEETTGVLAAFAQAGLLGSDAGTSFKSMLQRLANPSKESAELMKKFGIEAYNASGELVTMTELAGQLETAFVGQSQATRDMAMSQIFGSDAIRAANVLYSEGADGIASWTDQVNDAGYAAETAATRMDNLKGDLEQLGGALETAFISTGDGANGPLRSLVQDLTRLVDVYNELPAPVKESTMRFLALTAAIGGIGFVGSRAVTGFADLANFTSNLSGKTNELTGEVEKLSRTQLFARGGAAIAGTALLALQPAAAEANKELGILTSTAAGAALGFAGFGPVGALIGGTAGAAWGLVGALNETQSASSLAAQASRESARQQVEAWGELGATLDGVNAKITENTRLNAAQSLQESGLADKAATFGIPLRDLVDVALGAEGALKKLDEAVYGSAFANGTDISGYGAVRGQLVDLAREFGHVTADTIDANIATIDYQRALGGIPPEVQTEIIANNFDYTNEQIRELQRLYGLTPEQVETFMYLRDYMSNPVAAANELLYGLDSTVAVPTLDLIDNATVPLTDLALSLAGLDGTIANPDAILTDLVSTQSQIALSNLMGLDTAQATPDAYLNDYASGGIAGIAQKLADLDGSEASVTIRQRIVSGVTFGAAAAPGAADGGLIQKFGWGGFVSGPGGPREDKVPAMLSDGEFVQRAAAVDKYGTKFMAALNEGRIDPAALRATGYAGGGSVGGMSGGSVTATVGDVVARLDPRDVQAIATAVITASQNVSSRGIREMQDDALIADTWRSR